MAGTRTYIVTGGAGFVGSNLVAEITRRDPASLVVVVDSMRSGSYANIVEACQRQGVGPFTGEVVPHSARSVSWEDLVESFDDVAAIFHLGAITDTTVMDEPLMIEENAGGFGAMLTACLPVEGSRQAIPLVYASSAAVYGTPTQVARREAFPVAAGGVPNNVYGFSKWLMECEHRRLLADYPDAPVVGLRYFNVFGPGESRKGKMASMVYQLARQLLEGKSPRLFTDGSQSRDQVYVDDVVDCTLHASGVVWLREGRGSLEVEGGGPRGSENASANGDAPATGNGHTTRGEGKRRAGAKSSARKGAAEPRGARRGLAGGVTPGVYNLGSGVATSFNEIVEAVRGALKIEGKKQVTEYFEMPASVRAFYQDFTLAEMGETERGLEWRPRWEPKRAIAEYVGVLRGG